MVSSSIILSTTAIFVTFLHLLSPLFCFDHTQPLPTTRGLIFEEKSRLGSIPPSCHNKCNQCHPCMAVQVPSLPSQNPVHPSLNRPAGSVNYIYDTSVVGTNNKYSNYKPLGWKCRCEDSFYNP